MNKLKVASIALICALCLAFSGILVGCDGPQTPTQAADSYLKELKTGGMDDPLAEIVNSTDVAGDYSSNENALFDSNIQTLIVQKLRDFDYSVGNEKIDGDTATVDVTIKTYNLGEAFTNFFKSYWSQALVRGFAGASQDELSQLGEQIFTEEIEKAPKDYEATVPLTLTKVDGNWEVVADSDQLDFADAIMGGVLTSFTSLAQVFGASE